MERVWEGDMMNLSPRCPLATTPFSRERQPAPVVEVSIPTIVITVVVLLIVLGLLYLAVQRAGEGDMLELAAELVD